MSRNWEVGDHQWENEVGAYPLDLLAGFRDQLTLERMAVGRTSARAEVTVLGSWTIVRHPTFRLLAVRGCIKVPSGADKTEVPTQVSTDLNRQAQLAARPHGFPKDTDFRLVDGEIPRPGEGQMLCRDDLPFARPIYARTNERGSFLRRRARDRRRYDRWNRVVGRRVQPRWLCGRRLRVEWEWVAGVCRLGRTQRPKARPVSRPDFRRRLGSLACRVTLPMWGCSTSASRSLAKP